MGLWCEENACTYGAAVAGRGLLVAGGELLVAVQAFLPPVGDSVSRNSLHGLPECILLRAGGLVPLCATAEHVALP